MSQTAEEFIQEASEVPVMPPIAAEIMRKAEDPDSDLTSIAQLISSDASLAIRVLRIANSSFYSMPRKIETLQQSIILLGYSTLRSVVIAASMKDVFARFGLAERLLWEHAVAAAVATNMLAREVGGLASDELFIGGLVHDVGKLVMHSQDEPRYQEVMREVYADNSPPIEVEQRIFGFDHAEVGELILNKWSLPVRLATAVGAHHDPESGDDSDGARTLASVLQVADRICLREGYGRRKPDTELQPLECFGAELLGIVDMDLDSFAAPFREAYESEKAIFG
jgi:putative nucleotidyltransferase with HDIG domain